LDLTPVVPIPQLGECDRRTLAEVWAFRARSEQQSEQRFARLARELGEVGADAVVVRMAHRAVADEGSHARICASMAARYGHCDDGVPVPPATAIGPRSFGPRRRMLFEVVAFACITETVNAALMTETYRHATVPAVRDAVRHILKDEVGHSRMGWAHLSAERARGEGEFVAHWLPRMLRGTVADELLAAHGREAADPALMAHGELPEPMRLDVFRSALRDVIFPGLESLGIDTRLGREWLARASPLPAYSARADVAAASSAAY
jgi:hypothetical protein